MLQHFLQRIKNRQSPRWIWSWGVAAALATTLLSGCGGQQADTAPASDSGEVIIGLTDAEGDFLNYLVEVVSIELIRSDDLKVETLPLKSRIDFSQYVDLTELITAATIPRGTYSHARLTLDYSVADVQVEVDGAPTPAALVDAEGKPLTTLTVAVRLDEHKPLRIEPGIPAHLTLDFDLQASHEVDTSQTPPLVTVEPVLLADVGPKTTKPHRLRGLLEEVDPAQQQLTLAMRPLLHNQGYFGNLPTQTDSETLFEIDGVSYQGEAGLAAMAELPQGTWTIVFGTPTPGKRTFLASEIYAGSSVAGASHDSIVGVVVARQDDLLTVDASVVVSTEEGPTFHRRLNVRLAPDTPVSRQGSSAEFDKDDISVGQAIHAIGTLTADSLNDLIQLRMVYSNAAGKVVSSSDGGLAIELHDINTRPATLFDFSGTGVSASQDADPDRYEIDTASLSIGGLGLLDPIQILGFVTPWGTAPADFETQTLNDFGSLPTDMAITWPAPAGSPFSSLSAEALVINLDESLRHHIKRRPIITDLSRFETPPTLRASRPGSNIFAIRQGNSIQIYSQFEEFSAALGEALDGTTGVTKIVAQGHFDNASVTMNARRIGVILKPIAP